MEEFSLGIILGIIITCIITSAKTADLLGEIDKLKIIIYDAIHYINTHKQIYDLDGTEDNELDEFDALARPNDLLEILEGSDVIVDSE